MIARGNRKENIFLSDNDYQKYISLLAQYKEKYCFKLYAYTLMPNHVHLLIETSETPLSKIMQGVQQSYTQYFNIKYRKVGHLFQGRYKALLCQKDIYLLVLVRYIHLNPVRLGISELVEYPWTSLTFYLIEKDKGLVDTDIVLRQFSENLEKAREQFKRYLYENNSLVHQEGFYQVEKQILGEKDFVDMIYKKETKKESDKDNRNKGRIINLNLVDILDKVCKKKNLPPTLIKTNIKAREIVLCRDLFIYLTRIYLGYQLKDIARFLGISLSAITKRAKYINKVIISDRRLADEIGELIKEIESVEYQA